MIANQGGKIREYWCQTFNEAFLQFYKSKHDVAY